MKKARKIICILSVLTLLLTLLSLWALRNAARNLPYASFKRNLLTTQQQNELCDLLQFELVPGESIFTIYGPSAMEDLGSLLVYVYSNASEEDFLSRLHAETGPITNSPDFLDVSYDFWERCFLFFLDDCACFNIFGPMNARSPELLSVITSLYPHTDDVWMFFNNHGTRLSHAVLWGGIALEIGFITSLIVLRRKAKKEQQPVVGDGLPDVPVETHGSASP